ALDRAPDAAEPFGLGRRGKLVMQPAQRPLAMVERQVALRDDRFHSARGELLLTEGPGEEPARVLAGLEVDDKRPLEVGLGEDHAATRARQRSDPSSWSDASSAFS